MKDIACIDFFTLFDTMIVASYREGKQRSVAYPAQRSIKLGFFENLSKQFHIHLDPQQQEAVKHRKGPALTLAGPGSGKTTVIVSRTAYLVMEAGIRPENILTVTFNRAAGREMGQRFEQTFGQVIKEDIHFSTLHSFCNGVLRQYERMKGKSLKRIEGKEDSEENKRKILRNIYYEIHKTAINEDEIETLLSELSLVKNTMLKELGGERFSTKGFQEIYQTYESYKKANLMVDFDDMLTYVYSILSRFPRILEGYRRSYPYIQVDEGQDLSNIQFEIIKLLAGPENNIFIVADDDQSIYGFRGAQPEHILSVSEHFPGCRFYYLENNYRSCGNIVDISSQFIKNNKKRYDKNHKVTHAPAKDPVMLQPRDENSQIKFLVDTVKSRIVQKGKNVGILYRNNLSSIAVAEAFLRNHIPFALRQNKVFFFNHWAVLDVLAFLRFAMDQKDTASFLRICFKMNRFLSKAMVEHGLSQPTADSLLDNLLTYSDLKAFQISRIEGIKAEFKRLARMQTSAALHYIENDFKYFESIREYCDATGISFEYVYRLFGILKTLAAEYSAIPIFLQRLEQLESCIADSASYKDNSRVTLSTIHSAKGLEYDCVIMVDVTEEEIPGRKAVDAVAKNKDTGLLEEERRLFYVGITRAKRELFLTSPQYVNGSPAARSVFISELAGVMNRAKASALMEGTLVYHKYFGYGRVVALLDYSDGKTTIEIDFSGIRRKLDFTTCMENGLLQA